MNKIAEKAISSTTSTLSLLGVLFVGLKLTGNIDWSWAWVTLPFWWTFAILAILAMLAGVFALIGVVSEK